VSRREHSGRHRAVDRAVVRMGGSSRGGRLAAEKLPGCVRRRRDAFRRSQVRGGIDPFATLGPVARDQHGVSPH